MIRFSGVYKDMRQVEDVLKHSFNAVKDEMDNHLDSINRNTDEIQVLYDYFGDLEAKLEKISERLDQMEMVVNPQVEPLACENTRLNRKEQEIFTILYTSSESVTTLDLSKRLGFTEEMVITNLYNLIAKGIPIKKQCVDGIMLLSLGQSFKAVQAKNNMVKIEESVKKQVMQY